MDLAALAVQALRLALALSLPALLACLVVSVVLSFFELTSQGQDSGLGFVPRLFAVGGALFVGHAFMASELTQFTSAVFVGIRELAR
jgi:flagellar biosynthetic protein FliQ